MAIPSEGQHDGHYTVGETRGLIAPLLGCEPEDLGDIVIIAGSSQGSGVGIHTTFSCKIPAHWRCQAIIMMTSGIDALSTAMYNDAIQHGPEEGP